MELSTSRKLLAVISTLIISLFTATALASIVANPTVGTTDFLQKNAITPSLVSECEAQLTAKFTVLEEESGIPISVFETVKNNYPVSTSLRTAFQNIYGNESSELYNSALVDHFELLCTDYLDGNEIKYEKEAVRKTAEEAAQIFSETVGLHNMNSAAKRIKHIKDICAAVSLVSIAVMGIMSALLLLMFSNKKHAQVYIYGGLSGGALGAAVGAMLLRVISPVNRLTLTPEIYKSAIAAEYNKYFLLLALVSAAAAIVAWVAMYITYKQFKRKSKH